MRVARESRGFSARSVRHWPVLARSAGALFIRSYERGERVHLAMLSRGYTGSLTPGTPTTAATTPRRDDRRRDDRGPDQHDPQEPRMSTPVLDVRGLAYAYPDGHQALFGVDLHVHRGERVALLGPNGAGKTTLVLHLNGILAAGAGSVSVSGLPVTKPNVQEIRRRVGIVFQDPDDQLFMPTVRDDVAFGPANLGLRGEALERRVREALDQVGMVDFADRPPHHLSFGQRRRVAVATVLAMEPEILVLDEPSSNLDPASRRELAEILRGARRDRADGHPRPALRARAVPAVGGALRRRDRRGRGDVRRAHRRRADVRAPPRAAVRLRSPHDWFPLRRVTFD